MRYNGIFRPFGVILATALVVVLMVPAPGLAQDKVPATAPVTVMVMNVDVDDFADRFDSLEVTWDEAMPEGEPDQDAEGTDIPDTNIDGPFTGYRVYYSEDPFTPETVYTAAGVSQVNVSGADTEAVIIDGLDPDTEHHVAVAAMNAQGVGPILLIEKESTRGADAPDRVTGVVVEPGDRSLMVTWTAPYSGHSTLSIKGYWVQYRTSKTDDDDAGDWAQLPGGVPTNSAIIVNLESNTSYDVQVSATNTANPAAGPWSLTESATTAMGVPTMPEILTFLLAVTLVGAGVYVIRRRSSTGLTPA